MKKLRFRTVVLAILVTGGSSVIGVGLGRVMTKTVLAAGKPKPAPDAVAGSMARATNRASRQFQLFGPDEDVVPVVLSEIHLNPQDIPRNQPDLGNLGLAPVAAAVNPVPLWNY